MSSTRRGKIDTVSDDRADSPVPPVRRSTRISLGQNLPSSPAPMAIKTRRGSANSSEEKISVEANNSPKDKRRTRRTSTDEEPKPAPLRSRRGSISKVIEEEKASIPNSPGRRSTRLSSSSPSLDVPARRTRRSSQDSETVEMPARRTTRGSSTGIQESTIEEIVEKAKPMTRRRRSTSIDEQEENDKTETTRSKTKRLFNDDNHLEPIKEQDQELKEKKIEEKKGDKKLEKTPEAKDESDKIIEDLNAVLSEKTDSTKIISDIESIKPEKVKIESSGQTDQKIKENEVTEEISEKILNETTKEKIEEEKEKPITEELAHDKDIPAETTSKEDPPLVKDTNKDATVAVNSEEKPMIDQQSDVSETSKINLDITNNKNLCSPSSDKENTSMNIQKKRLSIKKLEETTRSGENIKQIANNSVCEPMDVDMDEDDIFASEISLKNTPKKLIREDLNTLANKTDEIIVPEVNFTIMNCGIEDKDITLERSFSHLNSSQEKDASLLIDEPKITSTSTSSEKTLQSTDNGEDVENDDCESDASIRLVDTDDEIAEKSAVEETRSNTSTVLIESKNASIISEENEDKDKPEKMSSEIKEANGSVVIAETSKNHEKPENISSEIKAANESVNIAETSTIQKVLPESISSETTEANESVNIAETSINQNAKLENISCEIKEANESVNFAETSINQNAKPENISFGTKEAEESGMIAETSTNQNAKPENISFEIKEAKESLNFAETSINETGKYENISCEMKEADQSVNFAETSIKQNAKLDNISCEIKEADQSVNIAETTNYEKIPTVGSDLMNESKNEEESSKSEINELISETSASQDSIVKEEKDESEIFFGKSINHTLIDSEEENKSDILEKSTDQSLVTEKKEEQTLSVPECDLNESILDKSFDSSMNNSVIEKKNDSIVNTDSIEKEQKELGSEVDSKVLEVANSTNELEKNNSINLDSEEPNKSISKRLSDAKQKSDEPVLSDMSLSTEETCVVESKQDSNETETINVDCSDDSSSVETNSAIQSLNTSNVQEKTESDSGNEDPAINQIQCKYEPPEMETNEDSILESKNAQTEEENEILSTEIKQESPRKSFNNKILCEETTNILKVTASPKAQINSSNEQVVSVPTMDDVLKTGNSPSAKIILQKIEIVNIKDVKMQNIKKESETDKEDTIKGKPSKRLSNRHSLSSKIESNISNITGRNSMPNTKINIEEKSTSTKTPASDESESDEEIQVISSDDEAIKPKTEKISPIQIINDAADCINKSRKSLEKKESSISEKCKSLKRKSEETDEKSKKLKTSPEESPKNEKTSKRFEIMNRSGIDIEEEEESSSDEIHASNEFIDDMAEEDNCMLSEEEDENEIIDIGESVLSSDSEEEVTDDEYDLDDPFIDNDQDDELLSGEEEYLREETEKPKKKKFKKIICPSDNSSEDEISHREELETSPEKNVSKSIPVAEKEQQCETPKKKKDKPENLLDSLFKLNPGGSSTPTVNVSGPADTSSVTESSLIVQETCSVAAVKSEVLMDKIHGVVTLFCQNITEPEGDISLNVSLNYKPPSTTNSARNSLNLSAISKDSSLNKNDSPSKSFKSSLIEEQSKESVTTQTPSTKTAEVEDENKKSEDTNEKTKIENETDIPIEEQPKLKKKKKSEKKSKRRDDSPVQKQELVPEKSNSNKHKHKKEKRIDVPSNIETVSSHEKKKKNKNDHSDDKKKHNDHSHKKMKQNDHCDVKEKHNDHSDVIKKQNDHCDVKKKHKDHSDIKRKHTDHYEIKKQLNDHSANDKKHIEPSDNKRKKHSHLETEMISIVCDDKVLDSKTEKERKKDKKKDKDSIEKKSKRSRDLSEVSLGVKKVKYEVSAKTALKDLKPVESKKSKSKTHEESTQNKDKKRKERQNIELTATKIRKLDDAQHPSDRSTNIKELKPKKSEKRDKESVKAGDSIIRNKISNGYESNDWSTEKVFIKPSASDNTASFNFEPFGENDFKSRMIYDSMRNKREPSSRSKSKKLK